MAKRVNQLAHELPAASSEMHPTHEEIAALVYTPWVLLRGSGSLAQGPIEQDQFVAQRFRLCAFLGRWSCRLKTPTLGIISRDVHREPVTIPAGAIVKVVNGPLDSNRLMDVIWEDKTNTLMMFTQDLRARAEPVDGAVEPDT